MHKRLFVSGIDTEIGKTIISAILTEALQADYWKPIQSGDLDNSDTHKVQGVVSNNKTKFHQEAYRLHTPMSPHASAEIDGVQIELDKINIPSTDNQLIIEGAGGLFVPLNNKDTILDMIAKLEVPVLLVSKHYLGSINHTLLSVNALKNLGIPIAGIIFNGAEKPSTESIIKEMSSVPIIGRIDPMNVINSNTIKKAANNLDLRRLII